MTTDANDSLCRQVEEQLEALLDGELDERLLEHVAGCDRCRDLRHDMTALLGQVQLSGSDYVHPADFEQRVLSKLSAEDNAAGDAVQAPAEPPDASQTSSQDTAANEPAEASREQPADATADEPKPDDCASSEERAAPPKAALAKREEPSAAMAAGERLGTLVRGHRGKVVALGVLATMAAAAAVVLAIRSNDPLPLVVQKAPSEWTGTVQAIEHAGKDGRDGLLLCDASAANCAPARGGQHVHSRAVLRTDGKTRAQIQMNDGSVIAIDRATELLVGSQQGRSGELRRGVIVADVAHRDDSRAVFDLPTGRVEVLGTKFTLSASPDRSTVEVARGAVRLTGRDGGAVVVRAGEEGAVVAGKPPTVASVTSFEQGFVWSERATDEGSETQTVQGLGELRARKPGEQQERSGVVRLARHQATVRIAGAVARTEIDETFSNESDDVLEGIYRFPLPPDAQIERLALDVEGKLEEGAFVEKDRAAAIWRGVLHAAAPKALKPLDEIIWVPGPWRDPALLEWQRGGRFELRIFPIPKRGSRRVVLAYTQSVSPAGSARRYTYPLSYDPSGASRADDFRFDVQVRGHDPSFGVHTRGYDLRSEQGSDGAERLTMQASSFVPSGDLTVEFALPGDSREVTAWAYQHNGAGSQQGAAAEVLSTDGAYAVIALRPRLPRWSEDRFRDHVLVVDASRSMVGERFARAAKLVEAMVEEMDRRDRVTVLACDTTCRAAGPELMDPGPSAAQKVRSFLSSVQPDGATDLVGALRYAMRVAQPSSERELRITFVGDGTPSVGAIRSQHIMRETARLVPDGKATVSAVAVGADADTTSLAALARGGGGVMIPYLPGERMRAVALRVLGTAYGRVLRRPALQLPEGLTDVYPKVLDSIPAGSESLVVARMTRPLVDGTIRLRGTVGGEDYEQSYPIRLEASSSPGNAFVPRVYAATKIADLEASQGEASKSEVIELSKRFAVASRFTSLLVLESEAMFRAFGVERTTLTVPLWTGEHEAESSGADGITAYEEAQEAAARLDGMLGGGEAKGKASTMAAPPAPAKARESFDEIAGPFAAAPPAAARPSPTVAAPDRRGRRDNRVPMRRVWDRKGSVSSDVGDIRAAVAKALTQAEAEAYANPDSRTKLERLLGLYAVSGQLDRADQLASRWASRDPLDPGALVARADLAARRGDRATAVRILQGMADVRPGDPAIQEWLAGVFEAMGDREHACAHRLALAQHRGSDATALSNAVSCSRSTGWSSFADALLSDINTDTTRAAVERELGNVRGEKPHRGDLRVEASWEPGVDLDVALVSKRGQRLSWLGDPKGRVTVRDAVDSHRESLAVFNAPAGEYVVELTRASDADDGRPVHGTVRITAAGVTRTVPFVMTGTRTEVAAAKIFYTSRLVEAWDRVGR